MNRVVAVDHENYRLTVEAGMTLHDLIDAILRNGMSMPATWLPFYANLTVGGVIASSAHGTSAGVDSGPGDLLQDAKWVNGKGEVIVSRLDDPKRRDEIRGLIGGLGLLGVLTEVTFQLRPPGELVEVGTLDGGDTNLDQLYKEHLSTISPNIMYYWRPDLRTYRAFTFRTLTTGEVPRFPYHLNGKATIDLAGTINRHMRVYTLDYKDSGPNTSALNAQGCELSRGFLQGSPVIDGDVLVYNATIPAITAAIGEDCHPECFLDAKYVGATTEDVEFAIPMSDLGKWMDDVRAVVQAEERERQAVVDGRYGQGAVKLCMNPGFSVFRFEKSSDNLSATSTGVDGPVAYVMFTSFASANALFVHPKSDHIVDTVEQMMLCKYGGRPHYGKNYDRIFTHPRCHLRDNFPAGNFDKMLKLRAVHDPRKVFEPDLMRRVINRQGPVYRNKCALLRTCYCEKDSHCADGFRCRPSVSHPEFKVCKVEYD